MLHEKIACFLCYNLYEHDELRSKTEIVVTEQNTLITAVQSDDRDWNSAVEYDKVCRV